MKTPVPTIVAIGGGGFLQDFDWQPDGSMESWLVELARILSGIDRPRILYLGQASAENESMLCWFYQCFSQFNCQPTHFDAFKYASTLGRLVKNLRELIRAQHIIYVGGGNTTNMLAIWRAHGLDKVLHEAWQAGIILSGMSAGANCWFQSCTTDSFGEALQPSRDGLGFLTGSCSPHHSSEAQRRPAFKKLIGEGALQDGIGIDDHVGVVYSGVERSEVVATRKNKTAYLVKREADGSVIEAPLEARYIGPPIS